MEIYLIRHGQSSNNALGTADGRSKDPSLTEIGFQQAAITATYLANADWQVPCIELGYFLSKDNTGKGFATEAARGVIRFAFEHLKVARIELHCAADNQASMKVAERCGFQLEGRLRQRHHKKDGTRIDRLWYGLLLSEWQAPWGGA